MHTYYVEELHPGWFPTWSASVIPLERCMVFPVYSQFHIGCGSP